MTGIRRLSTLLMALVIVGAACGGTEDRSDAGGAPVPSQTATTPGRAAIPDAVEPGTADPDVKLQPFFDEAGTESNLAVSPGDRFDVYICAMHPHEEMATAQWRLEVPDGVEVLGENRVFERALSLGSYEGLYVITYGCQNGAEMYDIVKYACVATDSFAGGEIRTAKGYSQGSEPPFLGFISCGEEGRLVPANAGGATLTLK